MELDLSTLADAVAESLSGNRCVSAWLGIGNVLFLGFGSESIAPHTAEDRRAKPPYELQTERAGWRVVGDASVSSDAERESAERAIEALVGRSVVGWRLRGGHALEIEFEGGWFLEVLPSTLSAPESPDSDEWWFCLPDGRFVGLGGDGHIVAGDTSRPLGNDA